MSGRLGWLLAASSVWAASAAAQIRPTATVVTRLLDPVAGAASPAIWLGGDLDVDRPGLALRLSGLGGPGWRGGWNGQATADLRLSRSLGTRTRFEAAVSGTFDHPARWSPDAAGDLRAGLARRFGPFTVRGGAMGMASSLVGDRSFSLGGFAATTFAAGGFELTGELGQFLDMAGSAGSPLETTPGADTGVRRSDLIRRLGHALLGGRWSHRWLELSGRLIRRSQLTPSDGTGWQLGVGVEPFAGARLRIVAARAPIGPSVYLPFRRQLSFGVELTRHRPRGALSSDSSSLAVSAFDWSRPDSGRATFRVRRRATVVELVGDFTDWHPVRLSDLGGGLWETTLPLGPGVHLINLRVDGALEVPPGLDSTDDGFGGRAGVLVVR